jgi:NosR/NirI family nitrous oxide reductase transcriptional regulator
VRILAFIIGLSFVTLHAQALDGKLQSQLAQLFPAATAFSPKGSDPPVYKALAGGQNVIGYAFWTTELEPLERGFDGPIKILVGMDLKGVLTGVIVAQHNEPYGNFSVDLPRFPAQFKNKSIRDQFKVGVDIDAVSRATITVTSASRAVRNSARRIARQLLTPPAYARTDAQYELRRGRPAQ